MSLVGKGEDARLANISMLTRSSMLRGVVVVCATVSLSGCATQALSERIRPHRRGEFTSSAVEGGDYGSVSVAGGRAQELVVTYDALVPSPDGGHREMRILLDRHQPGAPALVFTPPGRMTSFLYGDGRRQEVFRCIERSGVGDAKVLDGALNARLYAYAVFGRSDADVKAMAAERINPRAEYGEEAVARRKPLCIGLVIDPKGRIEHAMFGPWNLEPGRADGAPGACSWSPAVPVVDCLAETSLARELLMKSGYAVTVPVDVVTAPLQLILGFIMFARHEWGQ